MDIIKCPVCNEKLKITTFEKQKVDVCQTCGGIWFDKGELLEVVSGLLSKKVIEAESVEEAYKKETAAYENTNQFRRYCPKCKAELEGFNYSYDSNVFLDKCPVCSGVWADKEELEAVAKYIKGNPEVDKFAEALASELKKTSNSKLGRLSSRKAKFTAVVIALLYLIVAPFAGGLELFLHTLAFLVISLACIFFGEDLGRVTGTRFRLKLVSPMITKPTPGFIVVFGGWLWLLSPILFFLYDVLIGKY